MDPTLFNVLEGTEVSANKRPLSDAREKVRSEKRWRQLLATPKDSSGPSTDEHLQGLPLPEPNQEAPELKWTIDAMQQQTVKLSQRHDGQFCNALTLISMLARGEEPTDDPIEIDAAALDIIRKMRGPIQAPDDSNGANDKGKDENTPGVDIMRSMPVEPF